MTGNKQGEVAVLNGFAFNSLHQFSAHTNTAVQSMVWAREGDFMLTGSPDGWVCARDTRRRARTGARQGKPLWVSLRGMSPSRPFVAVVVFRMGVEFVSALAACRSAKNAPKRCSACPHCLALLPAPTACAAPPACFLRTAMGQPPNRVAATPPPLGNAPPAGTFQAGIHICTSPHPLPPSTPASPPPPRCCSHPPAAHDLPPVVYGSGSPAAAGPAQNNPYLSRI